MPMHLLNRFARTRIATRLAFTLGLVAIVMLSAVGYGAKKLRDTTMLLTQLEQQEWQVSVLASTWQGHAQAVAARVTASMRLPASALRESFLADNKLSGEAIQAVVVKLDALVHDSTMLARLKTAKIASSKYQEMSLQLEDLKRMGDYLSIDNLLNGEFEPLRVAYLAAIDELRASAGTRARQATEQARQDTEFAALVALVWVLLSLVVASIAALWLSRSITRPLASLVTQAQAMAQGDLSARRQPSSGGETGELERALHTMRTSLLEMVQQVRSSTDLVTNATTDVTGKTDSRSGDGFTLKGNATESDVAAMARSVHALQRTAKTMAAVNWVKANVAEISHALQGMEAENAFSQAIVSRLTPTMGVQIGALYLLDKSAQCFRMQGVYGFSVQEGQPTAFQTGKGLIGQCAQDGKSILLENLPQDALRIRSGLVDIAPRQVQITPIIGREGHSLAVLELATVGVFGEREKALLDELLPTLSMHLEILARNSHTRTLLEETTAQSTALRQQAQELDIARAKAEEATATKSMFLANMSHEIRTPMNAVIGLSYLCLQTEMAPKQRDYIDKIHRAGTSLLGIINDILDFSKIEAGKLGLENVDFWLEDVLSNLSTLTAQKAEEKGLELLIRVAPDVPQAMVGDPLRIGQVLLNLLSNAIKFTERGQVKLDIQVLAREGQRLQLRIAVLDTGIGMSKDQMARLFQAFSQADGSTTRKFGGTGLGLTIAKRLVELMDGQLTVDATPDVGTEFCATLWLHTSERQRNLRQINVHGMHALVVDDNDDARAILTENLSAIGMRVTTASSGVEGLRLLQQADAKTPFSLAFVDWRMPEMDGVEMVQRIFHTQQLTSPPKVVMVTAFSVDAVQEEGLRVGVQAFLTKPINASQLWDTIVNLVSDEPYAPVEAQPKAAGGTWHFNGLRVLLVEDNEINQQIAVELLESVGVQVEVAGNGRIAVERLQSSPALLPFDLVLMDLQMPEMDGHQATLALRQQARFDPLPIIAMTAHAMIEEQQRCLAEGMNDHITKPIDPEVLFATVGRWSKHKASPTEKEKGQTQAMLMPTALAAPISPNAPLATTAPLSLHIPGINVDEGLQRVNGNRALYLRVLRQFADKQAGFVDDVTALLASGDIDTAHRAAHTLKGVAATLGADALPPLAGALESALAQSPVPPQNDLLVLVNALEAPLHALVNAIHRALPTPDVARAPTAVSATASTNADTHTYSDTLLALLADSDPEAMEWVDTHHAALSTQLGPGFALLAEQITQCEFDDALATLHRLLAPSETA